MSPALSRGVRKAVRTLAQLAAGGALTALVAALADGLDPRTQGVVMAAFTALTALLQNAAESAGAIPNLLPSPALVTDTPGGLVGHAGAVVDMAMEDSGDISAEVTDVIGGEDE
jgi:hypothetical protein